MYVYRNTYQIYAKRKETKIRDSVKKLLSPRDAICTGFKITILDVSNATFMHSLCFHKYFYTFSPHRPKFS
jgi:hypothetical protein